LCYAVSLYAPLKIAQLKDELLSKTLDIARIHKLGD
jgi:hypothetical protein